MTDDTQRRTQILHAMGVQVWARRGIAPTIPEVLNATPKVEQVEHAVQEPVSAVRNDVALLDWTSLKLAVSSCTKCALHTTRTQTVFGVGDQHAQWMVVGEAPGADEDRQGEPFVGRAGKLLNEMLRALGLQREQVYIANVLKCRPPNNRDPQPQEVEHCEHYLKRQVELIKPKIILAVGRIAAQNLLKTDIPIGRLRGQRFEYGNIPLVVTYHPAYLLRSPAEKRKAWDDLRYARGVFTDGAKIQ